MRIVAFANLWERRGRRAVGRSDAPSAGRAVGRDGLHVRQSHPLGPGARLRVVQPRHGAAVGTRESLRSARSGIASARSRIDSARTSTTSRACASTRKNSIRNGSRCTWPVPGGLALPRILTNLAALISGGLRGVISK